jgi:L-aspartate oxidase
MNFDVVIVGSGLAGLSVALNLAQTSRVAVIAKRSLTDGASDWAQGGIAAVLDSADSVDEHVRDTLVAGAGICDETATRYIIENSRSAIEWLIQQGVPFTRDETSELGFHLTREGGHSHRRIIHAADATGHAVMTTLVERVRTHPNITLLEDYVAVDLITSDRIGLPGQRCHGLYALNVTTGRTLTLAAPHTVLATGGAGKVYLYTTNPDTSTGDGIAIAWRAGCRVSNMEFIQFHPTCLYHPYAKSFLISEAVRGEGGLLRLPDGTRFMPQHDERAELAQSTLKSKNAVSTACFSTSPISRPNLFRNTSPPFWRAAKNSASTSPPNGFRLCRRPITPAAASSPT